MKSDSLFYRLFQTLPQLLFDLIGQPSDAALLYRIDYIARRTVPIALSDWDQARERSRIAFHL